MTKTSISLPSVIPTLEANKRQDNPLWLKMWQNNQIDGFHLDTVNSLLIEYWHNQNLKKRSRILIPFCGKSVDMIWLAEQGFQVVGVELSPIAVRAFFTENGLKYKKKREGNFTCWKSGPFTIWCGDFFSIQKYQLGRIDSVFDKAALTALPAEVRAQYLTQLRGLIDIDVGIFLLTTEDFETDQGLITPEIDSEIIALFHSNFHIQLTHTQRISAAVQITAQACLYTDNKVYNMRQRAL